MHFPFRHFARSPTADLPGQVVQECGPRFENIVLGFGLDILFPDVTLIVSPALAFAGHRRWVATADALEWRRTSRIMLEPPQLRIQSCSAHV